MEREAILAAVRDAGVVGAEEWFPTHVNWLPELMLSSLTELSVTAATGGPRDSVPVSEDVLEG